MVSSSRDLFSKTSIPKKGIDVKKSGRIMQCNKHTKDKPILIASAFAEYCIVLFSAKIGIFATWFQNLMTIRITNWYLYSYFVKNYFDAPDDSKDWVVSLMNDPH